MSWTGRASRAGDGSVGARIARAERPSAPFGVFVSARRTGPRDPRFLQGRILRPSRAGLPARRSRACLQPVRGGRHAQRGAHRPCHAGHRYPGRRRHLPRDPRRPCRSYSGSYPTLRFQLSGCQEICAGVDCDDGNACTEDVCEKSTGACLHPDTDCDDAIHCTVDSCAPSTGCRHAPEATRCPDQPHCNQVKACSPVTGCGVDCSDGTICTTDTCNESTDQCAHTPAALQISLSNDLSYDVALLRCGASMGDPSAQCVLSEDGELQLLSDWADSGNLVTSGCSDGNNMACCFE